MRNPKQEGSNIYDCRVQTGPCPVGCNQCFYNRPGAYYEDIEQPHVPYIDSLHSIVRMNCGHDSNIDREKVIDASKEFPNVFFNTSIPKFDFPGPVVWTANPKEEDEAPYRKCPVNVMFIRLRVSSTNLKHVKEAIRWYVCEDFTPIVLTFMAYYDGDPPDKTNYVWKKRHINSYWCATPDFMRETLKSAQSIGGRLVTMCGTPDSPWCQDCRNCETYYWQTRKYMDERL